MKGFKKRGSVENGYVARLQDVTMAVDGTQIVKGVSIDVNPGEMLLVSGPSGSGKSTCIRMLAHLETPTTGDVELFGKSLDRMSDKKTEKLIADKISIATQKPALSDNRTAWENLKGISESLGRKSRTEIAERAGQIAVSMGVVHLLDRPARLLSGGEQCRVAIGRALVKEPQLLILDEPTHMVDPVGTEEIFDTLASIQRQEGFTTVVVSHDVEQARHYADREIVIASGLVVG